MRPTTFTRSLHPLAAVALMVACSGGSDTARAQDSQPEACALLPAPVAAEILGGEVETEEHGMACSYFLTPKDPENPIPDLGTQVTWSGGKAAAEEEVKGAGDKLRPVDGLGDGAWVSRYWGQLSLLLVDDVLVMFHMAMMEDVLELMMDTDWPELEKRFRELAEAVLVEL